MESTLTRESIARNHEPSRRLLLLPAIFICLALAAASCGGGSSSPSIGGGGTGGSGSGNGGNGNPPPAGETIPPSFFGMTAFYNTANQAYDFPAVPIGRLGHPSEFAWGYLELSKGNFNWSIYDPYVQYARQHGYPMVLTFGDTPGWAVADPTTCQVKFNLTLCSGPPANIQDWTDLVTAVVNRYKGEIKYYELWNEADDTPSWSGTPQQMEQLAAAAYPIIHTDPNAELLTPSTVGVSTSPQAVAPSCLAQFLQAGGSKYADGGTFHAYLAISKIGLNPFPYPDQNTTSACTGANVNACHGSIQTMIQSYRAVLDATGCPGSHSSIRKEAGVAREILIPLSSNQPGSPAITFSQPA